MQKNVDVCVFNVIYFLGKWKYGFIDDGLTLLNCVWSNKNQQII